MRFHLIIGIIIFILINVMFTNCHIIQIGHLAELKKTCELAYTCFHDTVIICGKSVNEARTFLDICDLYEYSCEHSMVYRHSKEEEGICPNEKELGRGVG